MLPDTTIHALLGTSPLTWLLLEGDDYSPARGLISKGHSVREGAEFVGEMHNAPERRDEQSHRLEQAGMERKDDGSFICIVVVSS